jgi:hypothetical protein
MSPSIDRVVTEAETGWAGSYDGKTGTPAQFGKENFFERGYLEDLEIDGM